MPGSIVRRATSSPRTSSARSAAGARRSRRKRMCSTCGSIRAPRRPRCWASAPNSAGPPTPTLKRSSRRADGSGLARMRGRRTRSCAVSHRHQPRPHGRRAGAQDVEVARQLRRRGRRRQSDRRRRAAPGVRLARLHHGNRARRHRLHRGRRGLSQDSQHLPLHAGQPRRLRSGARCRVAPAAMLEFDRYILARTRAAEGRRAPRV